jgi:ATP-dependent DNA helicase RecG
VPDRSRSRIGPDTPIEESGLFGAGVLGRVGPRLGISTVRDLLFHLPRRYDDFSELSTIRDLMLLPDGSLASARLQVRGVEVLVPWPQRVGGGAVSVGLAIIIPAAKSHRTNVQLADETGTIRVTWFGRRFVERQLSKDDWIVISGKVRHRRFGTTFDNPHFQVDDGSPLVHVGRIVPTYRLTAGLTAATLRRAIRQALDSVGGRYPEYMTETVLSASLEAGDSGAAGHREAPVPIAAALESAHFPETFEAKEAALLRLGFDELLALQVGMVARDRRRRLAVGNPIHVSLTRIDEAVASVEATLTDQVRSRVGDAEPAHLTLDQTAAVQTIVADLAMQRPMMRLLQGDVGSGKTAVAALVLAFVADAGRQGALLAPTDLLARQHATALRRLLEPLGHGVTMLTGSMPAAERRAALELLAAPSAYDGMLELSAGLIVVGTQALLQEGLEFRDLALAVVDEQHRFGVAQREALGAKGRSPHVLLMTATPIPRTLGQIMLADLDVSDLHTLPPGRPRTGPLRIPTGIRRSDDLGGTDSDPSRGAYPLVVREVRAGHRVFVVVPLVEDDEARATRSAGEVAKALPAQLAIASSGMGLAVEPAPRIDVIHGKIKPSKRDEVMDRFRKGDLDVLVGTTVLEVGVDVPEATVMLIFDADRFGLAQLHQLRGRVGRGEAQSYCILVSDSTDETARARLNALVKYDDGFKLAELDLEIRREGELLGLHQSGLPALRVASFRDERDWNRAARVRTIAEGLVNEAGDLMPGNEGLDAELRLGWLARVRAGEVLDDVSPMTLPMAAALDK